MGKKSHTKEKSPDDFEGLEQQVYEAFLARGWIIPQTEGDVSMTEAKIEAEDNVELPNQLRDPDTVLRRGLGARSKVLALAPVFEETRDLLARAAREGRDISPDIEERMRHDREMADRKAEK